EPTWMAPMLPFKGNSHYNRKTEGICIMYLRSFYLQLVPFLSLKSQLNTGLMTVPQFVPATGATSIADCFTSGTFTSESLAAFRKPCLLVGPEPRADPKPKSWKRKSLQLCKGKKNRVKLSISPAPYFTATKFMVADWLEGAQGALFLVSLSCLKPEQCWSAALTARTSEFVGEAP
ncbi:40S ribosomal protein SA, partial [Galemys pyrenaicus]